MYFKVKKYNLEIITPSRVVFHEQVTQVRAPGIAGYFGVLAGHTPFITALGIGEIKVSIDSTDQFFATSGGFIEVTPQGVTILVETTEKASEIEVERAQNAKERAKKRLALKSSEINPDRARAALLRALNRIRIAERRS